MGSEKSGNFTVQKMTERQRKEALWLLGEGFTQAEVARMFKVTRQYIGQLVKPRVSAKTRRVDYRPT